MTGKRGGKAGPQVQSRGEAQWEKGVLSRGRAPGAAGPPEGWRGRGEGSGGLSVGAAQRAWRWGPESARLA